MKTRKERQRRLLPLFLAALFASLVPLTTAQALFGRDRAVDPGAPIALITSNYHMDRAVQTAKSAGFASVLRQPAPSSALYFGANVMWETVLEVNELAYGRGRRCFRPRENQRRK